MESKTLVQRNFSVSYYQISGSLWLAHAELQDEQHNIITKLEISVPDLKVSDASIEYGEPHLDFYKESSLKILKLRF